MLYAKNQGWQGRFPPLFHPKCLDKFCYLVTPQSVPQFGVDECHTAEQRFNASTQGGHDAIDHQKS